MADVATTPSREQSGNMMITITMDMAVQIIMIMMPAMMSTVPRRKTCPSIGTVHMSIQ